MICINCFHTNTHVSNSRPNKKHPQVWRRRRCPACGYTFTTYERASLAEVTSTLPDTFNLGILAISIAKAFSHTENEGKRYALSLAQTVEDTLLLQKEAITPQNIAITTHQVLKRFDELAAVQYAAQHGLISSMRRPGRPSLREHELPNDASPSR